MPAKLERCVSKVKKQGKEESSAYAICSASTGIKKAKGGKWKKEKETMKESKNIIDFINSICNNEFANAEKQLQAIVEEKIKARIQKLTAKK